MRKLLIKDAHIIRLLVILVFVAIIMIILRPTVFLSLANFQSMALQLSELGFLSIAAALVLMSGGIDLSVTGTASVSGIVAALIMSAFKSETSEAGIVTIVFACLVALCVGLLCGAVNAVLVANVGIPPMLATLGTMNLFTGIGIVLTEGSAISGLPRYFLILGNGQIFNTPIPFILFALACVIMAFFLNKTKLGYKLYIYGTNPIASFFSAVNNKKVVFSTYVLSGLVSAMAGLIMVSRINTAKADFGTSYGLQALLVAVLGGINPSGGAGKALGIFISIITLQFLSSGFNLLHVSTFLKDLTWGALLVFVMILNTRQSKKKKPLKAKTEATK